MESPPTSAAAGVAQGIQGSPDGAYARLAGLGLAIDGYRTERRELDVSSGFRRVTTEIVLTGGGLEGRGEDVTYAAEDHDDYPAELPLAGEWTFDGFSRHLGGLDLHLGRPLQQEFCRVYRRWGFESAALDLALRQAKLNLGGALGRSYRPVRFVLSTRLDIKPWLAVDPRLEFKLDPTSEWDAGLMTDIAATGRVRVLDFKSFYEGSPVDNPADPVQYRLVSETFPGTVLEDPVLEGPARRALRGQEAALQLRRAHPLVGRGAGGLGPGRGGVRRLLPLPHESPEHQAIAVRQHERAALLRRARGRGQYHALRRRPVRARHRPRSDPGAGQPLLRRGPQRRRAA